MWDFDNPDFLAPFAAIMGIIIVVFIVCILLGLVLYILRAIALSTLARNRGMSGAGLAWIPVIGVYRIGAIADDISEKSGSRTYFRYFLLGGMILSWMLPGASTISAVGSRGDYTAFAGIGTISWLLPIVTLVVTAISLNKIYNCYRPRNATAWTVLSVIFQFLQAIFLFVIRNDMPAWGVPPQAGYYPPPQGDPNWQAPPQYMGYGSHQDPPQGMGYGPPQAPNPPTWDNTPPSDR